MSRSEQMSTAESYLNGAGIKVIDRSYHCPGHGVADFIATERGALVVVRLMSRVPRDLSGPAKMHLRRIALAWMDAHGRRYDRVRVDVVAVHLEGTGGYTVEHVRSMA